MSQYELLDDLYAYNGWANKKILGLCEGLIGDQLDATRDIGFGSLRATLFHILTAERVWMERWTGVPWRPFPVDPNGMTLAEFAEGLDEVAAQRRSLIELHRSDRWSTQVTYQDSSKTEYTHKLYDLLLHVANHGVHHRAQALHYLKRFERTVPAGLDYIFYRLAATTVEQSPQALEALREFGLEVSTIETPDPIYDRSMIEQFYRYHDWATAETISMCNTVEVAALDRDDEMGVGGIRKSLLHMMDAEQWWFNHWNDQPGPFPQSACDLPLSSIRDQWSGLAKKRNAFIETVDQNAAMKVVTVRPSAPATSFRIGESLLHLVLHATHHRAQVINMLRRSDGRIHNLDLLYWPALSTG